MVKAILQFVLLAGLAVALGAGVAAVSPARAVAPMFSLGEVSLVDGVPAAYRAVVADTLSAELAARQAAPGQDAFVIHARLATLHTEGSRPARSQCMISLLVAREATGSIFAVAQGKVTVEEGAPERAELAAIKSATRSAFARASAALAK